MAFLLKDRVKETSVTTGTGTYTLAGAVAGFQSFSAIGNGNTTWYCATDGTDWEVGVGTYTSAGTTLARTTILASSNGGSAVSWAAGTRTIFCDAAASGIGAKSGTVTVSTSGSSVDFSGIPAGVRVIFIGFVNVSTNGTSVPLIQIGPVGGTETTGYLGSGMVLNNASAVGGANYTTGFGLASVWGAAVVAQGVLVLALENEANNTWVLSGNLARSDATSMVLSSGSKSLAGVLSKLSLVTANAWDLGEVNLTWIAG